MLGGEGGGVKAEGRKVADLLVSLCLEDEFLRLLSRNPNLNVWIAVTSLKILS